MCSHTSSCLVKIDGYKNCLVCGTTFPFRIGIVRGHEGIGPATQKYCSQHCAVVFRNKSLSQRLAVSAKTKGRPSPIKGRKLSPEQCEGRRLRNLGSKSHFWKGGTTAENARIRSSAAIKRWREIVFVRDDYRCIDCGQRGGILHADHLYPFASYPRLRFMPENGISRCQECHRKTPTYAKNALEGVHQYTGVIMHLVP